MNNAKIYIIGQKAIGLAIALVYSLVLQPLLAAEEEASIFSDGSGVAKAAPLSTESSSFTGTGRALGFLEVDDSNANIPASSETAKDLNKLLMAPTARALVGIESIIGNTDDRVRINPTTTYPYRATVLISFNTGTSNSRCTGWLIGSNTVATAGHCVHRGGGGSAGYYNVNSYRVFAGRNGDLSPYGSCTARRLFTSAGWANSRLDDQDYGAIKLNCNIGNTVGWYGFFWTSSSLLNLPTLIGGYPGDKPLTQWRAPGRATVSQDTRVFYQNDTQGGMSGSPVWYSRSASCSPCVMAVHAYGVYGSPPYSTNNHGTRITQAVYNNLVSWKNAP
jgi:glutamyl endopeptidase